MIPRSFGLLIPDWFNLNLQASSFLPVLQAGSGGLRRLDILLLKDAENGSGIGSRCQVCADYGIVEELCDGGKCPQMRLELILGDKEEDDEMDRLTV